MIVVTVSGTSCIVLCIVEILPVGRDASGAGETSADRRSRQWNESAACGDVPGEGFPPTDRGRRCVHHSILATFVTSPQQLSRRSSHRPASPTPTRPRRRPSTSLQSEGYTVNVDRVGSGRIDDCVVTSVRNPQTQTRNVRDYYGPRDANGRPQVPDRRGRRQPVDLGVAGLHLTPKHEFRASNGG